MLSPLKFARNLVSKFEINSSCFYSMFGLVTSYYHPKIISLGEELKYHFEDFELGFLYCFLGLADIIHFKPISF